MIAYADPELNLEDKKDMFNEELDLGEQVEEAGDRKSELAQVKQEVLDGAQTETGCGSGSGSGSLPAFQTQEQALSVGMAPRVQTPMAGGKKRFFFVQISKCCFCGGNS